MLIQEPSESLMEVNSCLINGNCCDNFGCQSEPKDRESFLVYLALHCPTAMYNFLACVRLML